jgi:hypothetical protein
MKNNIRSNFDMLRAFEPQLWRLGALAERYFAEDPNTSLLKLRQFSELLAQSLAARTGLYTLAEESQYELIRRLQGEGILPKEVKQVLDQIRVIGNAANHGGLQRQGPGGNLGRRGHAHAPGGGDALGPDDCLCGRHQWLSGRTLHAHGLN